MIGSVRNLRDSIYNEDMFDDEEPCKDNLVEPIPLLRDGWGVHGDYRLVGNGEVTNKFCDKWACFHGCVNVEKHSHVTLEGINYVGKIHVNLVRNFCKKPSCPKCFKSGFSVREAGNIEARLVEASKKFGLVEHTICSVPVKDYGLDYKVLRRKVNKMLQSLGIIGHVLIFHGFRYGLGKGWYFSPHWHALGFVLGGYSKCRNCSRKSNCSPICGGFDDLAWKNYLKTEYYTKIMGKRKSIFGTAWYQLNHSSYKVGVKRFHVATWAGCVSYRKLKVTVEHRKRLCPICQEELVRLTYSGGLLFVKNRHSSDYRRSLFPDFKENGVPVWSVYVKSSAVARSSLDFEDAYVSFPSGMPSSVGLSDAEYDKLYDAYVASLDKAVLSKKQFVGGD